MITYVTKSDSEQEIGKKGITLHFIYVFTFILSSFRRNVKNLNELMNYTWTLPGVMIIWYVKFKNCCVAS